MHLAEQALASRGSWLKRALDARDGTRELHARITDEIAGAVGALKGVEAAEKLRSGGLETLHQVIDPIDVGAVRDRVLDRLRNDLLAMAVRVGRDTMGWRDEFYVDDYLILRINFPYEVARTADVAAENPGIGRISPWMRGIAAARRVKDPVYDPKGYHRSHPPAAWAHGPHLDSWAGHSKDGLNIWWAMCDVPAEASMVLYPDFAANLLCDRRTLYLQAGYRLPPPTFVPLRAGEMLIFDPEILHGTHLNITQQTRVAVSMRLNGGKPRFDPNCFYAREFWRRAGDIEAGRFEAVLHLKREDNLAQAESAVSPAAPAPPNVIEIASGAGAAVHLGSSALVREGERIIVALPDRRIMVTRTAGRLHAVDAACPHYGAALADGGARGDKLYCPACAVAFDLQSGRSASPRLALRTFPVREDNGMIVLGLPV